MSSVLRDEVAGTLHCGAVRIVDVINLSSSAQTLLRERVLALRAAGVDNHIVCMDGPYVSSLRAAGIPVATAHLPRGLNPVRFVWSLLELVAYMRRVRPDLVHTHCSVPGFIGRLAARLAGVRVVFHTVHGFAFHEGSRGLSHHLAIWAERFAGRFTDLLLSQNRSDLELANRHRIVPPARMQFIGNGIDLGRFPARTTQRKPNSRPVITCVARMEGVKNHGMLLAAARLLHQRGEPFELWLVGGGARRAEYETLCAEWGLSGVVRFLGYRDDIPELLAISDISVLTSLKEGIPRAALEAMAAGLPVVATRVTGTREVVLDGETGSLVAVGDVEALAAVLARLLRDHALRERWGKRGREVVTASFDEAIIVRGLARAYDVHLHDKSPAGAPALASEVIAQHAAPAASSGSVALAAAPGSAARVGRNTAFRLASQLLSAMLNVVGMVLLGNHLSAAGYGEYVFYYAFLPLFAAAADLGAGVIVTREIARDPETGARRMGDGLMLKAMLGGMLLLVVAALAWRVMAPAPALLLFIVTAGALLDFSQDAAVWVFRAHERLEFEALLLLVSQVAWLAGIGIGVWLGASLPVLLAVALLAFLLRTLVGLVLVSRTIHRPRFEPNAARMWALVRESWPMGLSMLLVVLYGRTGVLALKTWASAADVACFNVAYMLSQPLGFISSALSMAAFPAIARFAQQNPGVLRSALRRAVRAQMLATLPLTAGLWLLADHIIPVLFKGADFASAADALRIVALGLPFIFLNLQSRYVLAALDRQRTYLWAVVTGLVVNVACCAFSVPTHGTVAAAWSFVAAEFVIFVICQAAASVHVSTADLLRAALRPAVAVVLMAAGVLATRGFGLPLALATGVCTYLALLVITRAVTRDELELLRGVFASLRFPGALAREAKRS